MLVVFLVSTRTQLLSTLRSKQTTALIDVAEERLMQRIEMVAKPFSSTPKLMVAWNTLTYCGNTMVLLGCAFCTLFLIFGDY